MDWTRSAQACHPESECCELCAGRSPQSSPARGHATPVRRTPASSPPSPTTPTQAVTNESLAWELLYDLNFQVLHPLPDSRALAHFSSVQQPSASCIHMRTCLEWHVTRGSGKFCTCS